MYTVRKDVHNNQDTERNKITKNDVYSSNNSKYLENEHQSKKSAIKEKKKVFILGDSMESSYKD